MYAIRDKKTKGWLYGTEKRRNKQLVSIDKARIYEDRDEAYSAMFNRKLDDKRFEVLEVSLIPKIKIDKSTIDEMVDIASKISPTINHEDSINAMTWLMKKLKL